MSTVDISFIAGIYEMIPFQSCIHPKETYVTMSDFIATINVLNDGNGVT